MTATPRFCPNCGAALTPDQRFCISCGQPVAPAAPPPPPPVQRRRGCATPAVIILALLACVCLAGAAGFYAFSQGLIPQQVMLPANLPFSQTVVAASTVVAATMEPAQPVQPGAAPTTEPTLEPATIEPPATVEPPGTAFDYQNAHLRYDPSLASQLSPATIPASAPGAVGWEVAPQHIEINLEGYPLSNTFHKPRLILYPIQAYVALDPEVQTQVDSLRAALAEQSPQAGKESLPFLPYFNAAQLFHSQVKYLGGKGMRYLTQYAQSFAPINNHELFYTYQGFSSDGQYYIIAILPVSHASLPAEANIPADQYESFSNNYQQYLADLRANLDAQDAGSFTPDLRLLDQMVESIEVK